jgi:hypothetical protein
MSQGLRVLVFNGNQCIRALPSRSFECAIEIVGAAHLQGLNLYPQCPARSVRLFEDNRGIWIGRIPKHGHADEPRQQLLEQFQSLATKVWGHEAHTRDVATGPRETGDESAAYRVAGGPHDDWNGRGRPLGRQRRERSDSDNQIDVKADQLFCQHGQPFEPIVRVARLEGDVFPFDPSQLRQGIEKSLFEEARTWAEHADRA